MMVAYSVITPMTLGIGVPYMNGSATAARHQIKYSKKGDVFYWKTKEV